MASCGDSRATRRRRLLFVALGVIILSLASGVAGQAANQENAPSAAAPTPQTSEPTQPQAPASTPSTSAQRARATAARRRSIIDDRVKALAASLNLNETQQDEVKKTLLWRQQETLRLRLNSAISGAERIERLRALQDQTVLRIRSVLNDEQKQKYDPLAVRKITPAPDQKTLEDWLKTTSPH